MGVGGWGWGFRVWAFGALGRRPLWFLAVNVWCLAVSFARVSGVLGFEFASGSREKVRDFDLASRTWDLGFGVYRPSTSSRDSSSYLAHFSVGGVCYESLDMQLHGGGERGRGQREWQRRGNGGVRDRRKRERESQKGRQRWRRAGVKYFTAV